MALNRASLAGDRIRRLQRAIEETSELTTTESEKKASQQSNNIKRIEESGSETFKNKQQLAHWAPQIPTKVVSCALETPSGEQRRVERSGTIVRSMGKLQQAGNNKRVSVQQIESSHLSRSEQATRPTTTTTSTTSNETTDAPEEIALEMAPQQVHQSQQQQPSGWRLANNTNSHLQTTSDSYQQHLNNQHQHRHHTPACLVASKLVSSRESPPLPEHQHHQPNCPHHNQAARQRNHLQHNRQHQQRQQQQQYHQPAGLELTSGGPRASCKQVCYNKPQDRQRPYMLVDYRPSSHGQHRSSNALHLQSNNNINSKRGHQSTTTASATTTTTSDNAMLSWKPNNNQIMKSSSSAGCEQAATMQCKCTSSETTAAMRYISQLYFLVHISLVLSLLLHHKNLVSNESQLVASPEFAKQQTSPSSDERYTTTVGGENHQLGRQSAAGDSELSVRGNSSQQQQPPLADFDLLPIPSTLEQLTIGRALVSSVVPSQATTFRQHYQRHNQSSSSSSDSSDTSSSGDSSSSGSKARFGRQVSSSRPAQPGGTPLTSPTDLLVGLLGYGDARNALHYLLYYLLASSVLILIALRLFRACASRAPNRGSQTRCSRCAHQHHSRPTRNTLDRRACLDCTPVLVGSISLGLVQLISIGLDIASNVDWLGNAPRRWPLHLPLLQFVFVALLMQLILGKPKNSLTYWPSHNDNYNQQVAKNWEQRKKSVPTDGFGSGAAFDSQADSSINARGRAKDNRDSNTVERIAGHCSVENIALAHLLVTHILLWLMRLNSISLFQSVEQQTSIGGASDGLSPIVVGQPPSNRFLSNLSSFETQSSSDSFGVSGMASPAPNYNADKQDSSPVGSRNNGFELESVLRRKSPQSPALPQPQSPPSTFLVEERPKLPKENKVVLAPTLTRLRDESAFATSNATLAVSGNNKLALPAQQDSSMVKNERGLRSTERDLKAKLHRQQSLAKVEQPAQRVRPPSAPLPAPLAPQSTSAVTASRRPPPSPIENSKSTVILNQAELAHLLSLASKSNSNSSSSSQAGQRNDATANGNTTAGVPFKSSLPKRMTAFRQAPKPALRASHNSGLEMVKPVARLAYPIAGVVSSGAGHPPEEVQRSQQDAHDSPGFKRGRRGRQNSPLARPFPSVDSDPPKGSLMVRRPAPAPASEDSEGPSHRASAGLDKREQSPSSESSASPPPELIEDLVENSLSDDGDESEETDVDLDSLLPPVPNYNETANDPSAGDPQQQTGDDESALVFNEAASTVRSTSIKGFEFAESRPAPVPIESSPLSSRLHRLQQQQQQQRQSQSTFTEYLLPIVHQYHILVVAILFNIWLDCLRVNRARVNQASCETASQQQKQQDANNKKPTWFTGGKFISSHEMLAPSIESGSSACSPASKVHLSRHEVSHPKQFMAHCHEPNHARQQGHATKQRRFHKRSQSADSAQQSCSEEAGSQLSGSPGRRSTRSSSSERLLWIPPSGRRHAHRSPNSLTGSPSGLSLVDAGAGGGEARTYKAQQTARLTWSAAASGARAAPAAAGRGESSVPAAAASAAGEQSSSGGPVCSVLFGLLVVSASLIVMLLGIELLSIVTQCLAQLLSIFVCLLGLCLTWCSTRRRQARSRASAARAATRATEAFNSARLSNLRHLYAFRRRPEELSPTGSNLGNDSASAKVARSGGRQLFNYLFLLAALYCGLATALNLGRQRSVQQVFSLQVIQFVQRHLGLPSQAGSSGSTSDDAPLAHISGAQSSRPEPLVANYLLIFHALLALKGLLLATQVTLQTALIRLSLGKDNLRQLYCFLMFANLSLWAMEICEQHQLAQSQQRLFVAGVPVPAAAGLASSSTNRHHLEQDHLAAAAAEFASQSLTVSQPNRQLGGNCLISLVGFTKFVRSIVSLSHLYHGLVFMQH